MYGDGAVAGSSSRHCRSFKERVVATKRKRTRRELADAVEKARDTLELDLERHTEQLLYTMLSAIADYLRQPWPQVLGKDQPPPWPIPDSSAKQQPPR